jgi:general secretion pathway protein D
VKPSVNSGAIRNGAIRDRIAGPLAAIVIGASLLPFADPAGAQDQIIPNYRETDIRQVIEAVGAVTGRTILPDPRVRAQVTLISSTPMTPQGFYEAFLAMLSVHSFVAIESDGIVRVIPDATARTMHGTDDGSRSEDFVTRVVQLQNIGAAQLVPLLRPLVPQYGHLVAAAPPSNMLIIADRAGNVARMIDIVRRMDQAGNEEFDFIRLENASAADIVRMVGPISQSAQAGGAPPVQIVADERTNSVVLSGPEASRLRFRAMITYLDTPIDQGGDTRVRYLYYTDAESLAERLQAQFGSAPEAQAEGGISIWADPGTNALIYRAPARVAQDMMAVVDRIDIRRAQVKVDAIIVEISEQKAAELGVTWAIAGTGSSTPIGITNFGISSGGLLQLGAAAAGDVPSPGAIPQGITAGLGRVRDSATSWAALVNALRGDSTTNIISTPTIVTMDNEEAEIRVGQQVPFLTGSFTSAGAQPGVVNPFQTVQREDVGTLLRITPQINEGDGVKLVITQETSSISQAAGAVDLITNKRSITTSVFVEDSEILVLGGLVDDQLMQGEQRVPGLGRIPGLGWLFRARTTDRTKTNLMVFIRPTIIRDSSQSTFQTGQRYNYLRDLQIEQAQQGVQMLRGEDIPILPEFVPLPETRLEPVPANPVPAN